MSSKSHDELIASGRYRRQPEPGEIVPLPRWEYITVDAWEFVREHKLNRHIGANDFDKAVLSHFGEEGWELIQKDGKWNYMTGETPLYLMKREIP